MPGLTEYLHAVQVAVDARGLRYRVLDTHGNRREWLEWPLDIPTGAAWDSQAEHGVDSIKKIGSGTPQPRLVVWRFSGVMAQSMLGEAQCLICGWDEQPAVWIGIEGCPARLTVRLLPEFEGDEQVWVGAHLAAGEAFDFQVGLHQGMGPGGILYRPGTASAWSSLSSPSARGAEKMKWVDQWAIGHGPSGPTDCPFRGRELKVTSKVQSLPLLG